MYPALFKRQSGQVKAGGLIALGHGGKCAAVKSQLRRGQAKGMAALKVAPGLA